MCLYFICVNRDKSNVCREDCARFLADYDKAIEEGYEDVMGDETWVNANHTVSHSWQVIEPTDVVLI